MTKLTVDLPDTVKAQDEVQAAAGGYPSVDQYICSLIQNDEFQAIDAETESELLRGLDSGPAAALTPALIAQIRKNARQC